METVRVFIIAGYASVRAGLYALLADASGVCVQGAIEGVGDSLARLLPDLTPDVLLLDTSGETRPDSVGDALLLLSVNPTAFVVVGDRPEEDIPRLVEADLPGFAYLLREVDGPQIVEAVRAAAAGLVAFDRSLPLPIVVETPRTGHSWLEAEPEEVSANLARRPAQGLPADTLPGETLTPREIEVLELMAEGLPNKIIASRLKISLHTAKFHVAQILGKLGAASRTEAVTIGARRGYVTL